jgi:hypothetical protein
MWHLSYTVFYLAAILMAMHPICGLCLRPLNVPVVAEAFKISTSSFPSRTRWLLTTAYKQQSTYTTI